MPRFTYDSLTNAAGTDLGHSSWIVIDQARIDGFAEVTGDGQWIHTDPARAADGPFGTTIAHGYLTLSLVAPVLEEIFALADVDMSVNYGTDRVRFPSPVPSGSRLRGHGQILKVEEVRGGRQATIRITMETEDGNRPACVADVLIRAVRS